jgi:MbtH protein
VDDKDSRAAFQVVVNHEEQYALWPAGVALPAGWQEAGMSGTKEQCLAHVESVWTDMLPASVRASRAEQAGGGAVS